MNVEIGTESAQFPEKETCKGNNHTNNNNKQRFFSSHYTVNVDFLRIEYMVLAKYQHMSILELILIIKQHKLILCTKATHVIKLGFALRFISTRAICLPK
jgi:hypothetical protein